MCFSCQRHAITVDRCEVLGRCLAHEALEAAHLPKLSDVHTMSIRPEVETMGSEGRDVSPAPTSDGEF